MVNLSLEQRTTLKRRTAESLTDPNFIALSTLEDAGGFISFKTKIKHTGTFPIKVELQYFPGGDSIEYHYRQGQDNVLGRVGLIEEAEEVLADLSINKIIQGKKLAHATIANEKVGHVHNGSFKKLNEDAVQNINYWVPTIINHIAKNANRYITKKEVSPKVTIADGIESVPVAKSRNEYSVKQPSVEQCLGEEIHYSSKSPHFRNSCERVLEGDFGNLPRAIGVSGFYVNPNWNEWSTPEIANSIGQNKDEIFPLYFHGKLLPRLVEAGHDKNIILKAYNKE